MTIRSAGAGSGSRWVGSWASRVIAGASYLWRDDDARFGRVFEQQPNGNWVMIREIRRGLFGRSSSMTRGGHGNFGMISGKT